MRKVSILIGICLLAGVALTLWAQAVEEQLSPVMKQVAPTAASLRMNLTAKDAKAAEGDAQKLGELFTQAQGIFKASKVGDAAKIAKGNAADAQDVLAAIKAGDWDTATAKAGGIQKTCKGCHDVHREEVSPGSKTYKFK
ncbi:MAG TPA: hypothetical protein VE422_40725 [Terriglobia bacterium]|nr:hypothetical protein [Terriglobia bacterium]